MASQIYISDRYGNTDPGVDYTIHGTTFGRSDVYAMLTGAFIFNSGITVSGKEKIEIPKLGRIENLQRYKRNHRALLDAIHRAFDDVAKGKVVGLKIECEPGVNRTAYIHKADMNG